MHVDDVLEADWDSVGPLNSPVMLVALRGWFDSAGAATNAIEWCIDSRAVTVVASIDPDPFFDFTHERPDVFFDEDGQRRIRWPENDVLVAKFPEAQHDLVILSGIEPHTNWNIFAECILHCAKKLGCEIAITVGAFAELTPHTRSPNVFGSTTNASLARRLNLSLPRYQGPTGLVGVLQERFDREKITAVSLRVGVPHYLLNAQHPKSSAALLSHIERLINVPTRHAELFPEIHRWEELHNAAVEGDDQITEHLATLEKEFDLRTFGKIPSAQELDKELELFLREQSDENPDE